MVSGRKWAQVPQETRAGAPTSDVSAKEGVGLLPIGYASLCAFTARSLSPIPPALYEGAEGALS
jgi:hypothetical protein